MTTSTRPSWREEIRQDRLINAQIERDRETARVQARIAERQAATQLRREDQLARAAARQQAREQRAERRATRTAWIRGHALDLLFVPVIVVPAVLAWTAMAAYGYQLYGPPGLVLPAFSEGAMWAFAIATTWTVRRYPDRPAWHLRTGTWVFAAIAASLNFSHGLNLSPRAGVVMALVSVAGVLAHQFITAGPRRSRADRHQARIDRAVARRELAVRRAAVRDADAVLDEDGRAHLIYQPGVVTLTRRHGRRQITTPPPVRIRPGAPHGSSRPPAVRTVRAADPGTGGSGRGAADPGAAASAGRAAFVAELAGQIRAAMDAGDRWAPDYDALMARSGFGRSWCGKAVRDARTAGVPHGGTGPGPTASADEPAGYDRAAELHDHLRAPAPNPRPE